MSATRNKPEAPCPLCQPLLIVVWMTVAPIPVVSLHSVALPVVLTVSPVLSCQVTPVSAVFVVVPVMVVTVVPIINPNLHAGFLCFGFGHNERRCSNGGGQE